MSMVTLKASDDVVFRVDEAVAFESQILKNLVEDIGADNAIPLPSISSKILAKVIEYCDHHAYAKFVKVDQATLDVKQWDAEFVNVDRVTLIGLLLAAHYLHVQSLLELTQQTLGERIKRMSPEEVREIFNIKNGFIPEEGRSVNPENLWVFT